MSEGYVWRAANIAFIIDVGCKRSDFITRLPHQHFRNFPLELQLIDTLFISAALFFLAPRDLTGTFSIVCYAHYKSTLFSKKKEKIDGCDGGGLST